MNTVVTAPLLQKYPLIGAAGGLGAGITHWIDLLEPILSFIGIALGVGIAAITFILKLKELKKCKASKK